MGDLVVGEVLVLMGMAVVVMGGGGLGVTAVGSLTVGFG